MRVNKKKLKLLIITSLIVSPSISYSNYNKSELKPTNDIDFIFNNIHHDLINRGNNRHLHGTFASRYLPNILTKKEIIIITDKEKTFSEDKSTILNERIKNSISYDSGANFEEIKINDFKEINFLNLSDNGQYAIGYGKKNNKNIFFTYNIRSKQVDIIDENPDIFYETDDYHFTTRDGLFSLYSEDNINHQYAFYVPFKEKNFFIYDTHNKTKIPLSEIENSQLKNHKEKERFKAYQTLDFLKDNKVDEYDYDGVIEDQTPDIMGVSKDGNFLYGSLERKGHPDFEREQKKLKRDIPDLSNKKNLTKKEIEKITRIKKMAHEVITGIRLAYIYNKKKNKLDTISESVYGYGSSRINALSDNNIAIGWLERMLTEKIDFPGGGSGYKDIKLLRKAFVYDAKESKFITPKELDQNSNYNSEATDISRDSNIIIGWAENNRKRDNIKIKNTDGYNKEFESENLRNGFIYFHDKKEFISLPGFDNENTESEAYTLSEDNRSVLGVAKNKNDQWKIVAWKINDEKGNKQINDEEKADKAKAEQERLDREKQRLADEAKEKQRLADEAKEKQRLADEAKEKQRLANEAKEKQRLADEAKEKQRLADEAKEKQRLADEAKEKQRLADEAKEKQRLADEAKEQQRLADEAKEKQRLADEAKEKQRLADEAKEKQRLADEDKEKQRLAEEAKEQQRLANEAKEKQRLADEAKEKQRLADEAKEKQRLADEAKEKQRLADEDKEKQRIAEEKAKELIPVEDELELRAKEKEKNKPSVTISKPIDIENTYKSMQLVAENSYKFMDMQQGQLRYLASATCSVGTKKSCISGFTHYQNVNKANATQTGLSGAYRFDINHIPLIVGLAIDTDVYSSLPKGYQYQGYALPLIGFSLDLMPSLNAELNNNALHLSLKGAYLNRKVSIERQALANTEQGKGNAKITGYHIELQGYYPYSIADDLLLTPFAGLTFNQISRSAYSETQNAQFAAHYDALKTHSLLAKMGLGMDYLLGSSFILNTKAGLLWNLSHHQGDFRSQIDYLGQQHIDYSENKKPLKQRPFAHVGLTYQFDKQSSINTSANWEMTPYRNHDMQFGISYTYRF
ncbi:autotransporter domain-containing protein [Proteus cibi]|uniref:autotransporter outer membrane beta-barrel domain-containing protein n=1 Tax=Proteus cibi TaxID=2050966 RepID=UPI0032DB72A2